MDITVRTYRKSDLHQVLAICNDIILHDDSFPWDTPFDENTGSAMLLSQTDVACACTEDGEVVGFYILHPNNIGRCGHIANASYGVKKSARGLGVGKALVLDSLKRTKEHGFIAMQFNAVVSTNTSAIALYRKLGFHQVGVIPNGFQGHDGKKIDTIVFYKAV